MTDATGVAVMMLSSGDSSSSAVRLRSHRYPIRVPSEYREQIARHYTAERASTDARKSSSRMR
ncbi:MAG: hypothetical protein ACLTTQ_01265 [Christensenellales bacterium]